LVVPLRFVQGEEWGNPFLCSLQETERHHEERLHSLHLVDDTLETLAGDKYFSTLDLKIRFWQNDVHPNDKVRTAALWPL
jgi:hypothetical protein